MATWDKAGSTADNPDAPFQVNYHSVDNIKMVITGAFLFIYMAKILLMAGFHKSAHNNFETLTWL